MDKALTLKGVAAFLDISESTVQRMVKDGELPQPTRIGKKIVRWFEADIKAAVQANQKKLDEKIDEVSQMIAGQF